MIVPHVKRTRRIYGEGEDDCRWYRCAHCGFPCKIGRNTLDTGEHGRSGVGITTTTIEDETVYYPVISGGCSFCGSKNWK